MFSPRHHVKATRAPEISRSTMPLMERHIAARLGQETVSILRSGGYSAASGRYVDLRPSLDACRSATVEYPPSRNPVFAGVGSAGTRIVVENETVLAIGRRMVQTAPWPC